MSRMTPERERMARAAFEDDDIPAAPWTQARGRKPETRSPLPAPSPNDDKRAALLRYALMCEAAWAALYPAKARGNGH